MPSTSDVNLVLCVVGAVLTTPKRGERVPKTIVNLAIEHQFPGMNGILMGDIYQMMADKGLIKQNTGEYWLTEKGLSSAEKINEELSKQG